MKKTKLTTTLENFLNWSLYLDIKEFRCMDDMKIYEIYLTSGKIKFKNKNGIILDLDGKQLIEFILTEEQEKQILENIIKMRRLENFIKYNKIC